MEKKKILVVISDFSRRFVAEKTLEDSYDVKVAASGEDAMEIWRQEDFNLILTDFNMGTGKINGIELANAIADTTDKISSTEERVSPAIVLMSGDYISLEEGSNISAILRKPFFPKELLEVVKNVLNC